MRVFVKIMDFSIVRIADDADFTDDADWHSVTSSNPLTEELNDSVCVQGLFSKWRFLCGLLAFNPITTV